MFAIYDRLEPRDLKEIFEIDCQRVYNAPAIRGDGIDRGFILPRVRAESQRHAGCGVEWPPQAAQPLCDLPYGFEGESGPSAEMNSDERRWQPKGNLHATFTDAEDGANDQDGEEIGTQRGGIRRLQCRKHHRGHRA